MPRLTSEQFEVGEGDAGTVDVALAPAARHPVQPAHVDTAAAPQRARPHLRSSLNLVISVERHSI